MTSISRNYTQRCISAFEKLKNCALVREKKVDKHTCAEFEAIANGCAPIGQEENAIVDTIREISRASTHINKQTGVVKSAFLAQSLHHYSIVIGGIVLAKNLEISDFAFILFSTDDEFCRVRSKINKNNDDGVEEPQRQVKAIVSRPKPSLPRKEYDERPKKQAYVEKKQTHSEKPQKSAGSSCESVSDDEGKDKVSKNARVITGTGRGRGKGRGVPPQAPAMMLGDFIKLRDDIAEKTHASKKKKGETAAVTHAPENKDGAGAVVPENKDSAVIAEPERPDAQKVRGAYRPKIAPAGAKKRTQAKNAEQKPDDKEQKPTPAKKVPAVSDKNLAEDLVSTSAPLSKSWADMAEEEDNNPEAE